jgi:putative ABC transport system permease protein
MAVAEKRNLAFERTLASAKRTMLLSEIFRLAIDSFRANKVRFALTALGMVIGSASLILVTTIGLTGKGYIQHLIQGIGINMVEVEYAGGGGTSVGSDYRNDYLTRDDEKAVDAQVPAIAASSPVLERHDQISFGSGVVKDILILGVVPQYRQVRNLVMISGRFFDEEDEDTHTQVAVVTAPFAQQLFGGPEAAINQTFKLSGIPFTIIGIFRERVDTFGQTEIADQTVLIPYSVARYFTGTDNVKQIYFSIRDQNDVEEAAQDIVKKIQARHKSNSVYKAQTMTELMNIAAKSADALTTVLLLVALVTLAVGGVGIMNIMLANVRSRIREIGIRKALGATAREIKLQFLVEAVLISLAGGLVGTLVGLAIPLSVRMFTTYRIPISGLSVIIALLAATIVGVVFGTLPANRAAELDPVESLKYE